MGAFLDRLLAVCEPESRVIGCQTGQEYRRYLNGVVGVRELRVRKNNLKGSALPYGITPGQHTEHISKAVVPQDAGWVCMGEK